MGAYIVPRENQDYTDCEKAITYADEEILPRVPDISNKNIKIITLGSFGGRMDHTIQNISILWKKSLRSVYKNYEILMLNNHNLMCVLKPCKNELRLSKNIEDKKGVGLVPLTECSFISTSGLLYDMGSAHPFKSMQFGSFISTSNQTVSETVIVETSHPLLWISSLQQM
jgi:thiamine pyrophosphokinase